MKNNALNKVRILLLLALFVTLTLLTYSAFGQNTNLNKKQHWVSGIVTDTDGIPIPGVHVLIEGTQHGTYTNTKGIYQISAAPTDVLSFSYVGFQTFKQTVGDRSKLDVSLTESIMDLGAVTVNAGYYTVSEKERTGSISTVKAADIEKQPVSNVLGALQGRMPGVYLSQDTGVPGGGFTVRIRGQNSISSGNDPLYIIDGVPFVTESLAGLGTGIISQANPLNAINPSDIESIEVLKDADATAIYGSRGANGVVLITTKSAKKGKTVIDLNLQSGIGRVADRVSILNTPAYLEMRNEAFLNDGVTPNEFNAPDLVQWDQNRNINWQDKLLGETAYINKAELSVSGGNTNTSFSVRGGFYKETTVFPGDNAYKRWSLNTNLNHRSENDRFHVNVTTLYTKDQNNLLGEDLTAIALLLPPNAPDFIDEQGDLLFYNQVTNPYVYTRQHLEAGSNTFVSNGVVDYELFAGLKAKINLGYTQLSRDEQQLRPRSSLNPASGSLPSALFGKTTLESWIAEPQLEYEKQFGKSRLKLLAGGSFQQTTKEQTIIQASGFSSDLLMENPAAASELVIDRYNYSDYKYQAFFGRINYSYADRYFLNLTTRRDGSSRFGPGKRFATFGAVGAAWLFSNESFIQNGLPFLSFGKLRGSYGVTGNDQIGDYEYLDTYGATSYPYQNGIGLYPTRLFNEGFGWERNKKLELALDLGFIRDRIMLSTGLYRNRSDNQLVGVPLPGSTGFTSIRANLPALVENTGWEFELATTNVQNPDFSWKTHFNITYPKNTLVRYPDLETSVFSNIYEQGRSLFIKKKFHYTEVDPQTGVYQYQDVNGDGQVSAPQDLRGIYELTQKYFGGLQNSLTYKNWQLDFFFQFVKQTGRRYTHNFPPGFLYNQPAYVMERWQSPGDQTSVQRFTQTFSEAGSAYFTGQQQSDLIYGDTSFIRLKNVSLGYKIPVKDIGARLYVQGQNLWTLTEYKGLNPESPGMSLPPLQTFVMGLQLTF